MKNAAIILGAVAFIGFIPAVIGLGAYRHYGFKENTTFVVAEKERITTGSGDSLKSKYLIFTDGEVFQNTDSIFAWKWGSSDLQGRMMVGETCEAEVTGWRVPFLSWYRNILSATCA